MSYTFFSKYIQQIFKGGKNFSGGASLPLYPTKFQNISNKVSKKIQQIFQGGENFSGGASLPLQPLVTGRLVPTICASFRASSLIGSTGKYGTQARICY